MPGGGRTLALLTDRAHGASSLKVGWLEVMLGRRVNEEAGAIPLDDTDRTVTTSWLLLGQAPAEVATAQRVLATQLSAPLIPLVTLATAHRSTPTTPTPPPARNRNLLPLNVHLLSLERVGTETTAPDSTQRAILRLQHIFQVRAHRRARKLGRSIPT